MRTSKQGTSIRTRWTSWLSRVAGQAHSGAGPTIEALEGRTMFSSPAFDLIGLTAARADANFRDIDGTGVTVAVLDTGLDATHPLLAPAYRDGFDFPNNDATPDDRQGHGTHVSGTVGARNPDIGVATDAGLVGIKVLGDDGRGQTTDIIAGLRWVADNAQRLNIRVVNMSLGGQNFTQISNNDPFLREIQRLEQAGITVVSAAGNSYADLRTPGVGSPAIASTIMVGAVWQDGANSNIGRDRTTGADRITFFSQRLQEQRMIFAPGAMILSTVPGNRYEAMPGTSMASPMVAGVVALLQEAAQKFGGRYLTPAEVRTTLIGNSDQIRDGDDEDNDLPATGATFARVNALRALQAVRAFFQQQNPGGGNPSETPSDLNGTISGAIRAPEPLSGGVLESSASIGTDGTGQNIGAKDVDMWQFVIQQPGQTRVSVTPTGFNAVIRVFDQNGQQLGINGGSGAVELSGQLAPGTYYLGVSADPNTGYNPTQPGSGAAGGGTGNYTISFRLDNADTDGSLNGAKNPLLGSYLDPLVIEGAIGTDEDGSTDVADVDFYRIEVPDNGQLLVDIDTPFNDFADTFIRVFDEEGNELVSSDDDVAYFFNNEQVEFTDGQFHYDEVGGQVGHHTDSFVGGQVQRGDVYYIGVSHYFNQSYDPITLNGRTANRPQDNGRYNLIIQFVNNDQNGAIPQAVDRSVYQIGGQDQPGIIGGDTNLQTQQFVEIGDRDVDFLKLQPTQDGILEIDIDSDELPRSAFPSGYGSVDTYVIIFDQNGRALATDDDGPNTLDPFLQYRVRAGQTYYLAIVGYGNQDFDPFLLGSGSPGDTGYYQLSTALRPVAQEDDLRDDRSGSRGRTILALGGQARGSIGEDNEFEAGDGDVDTYAYTPTENVIIDLRTLRDDAFGADTMIRVFDANWTEIAFNDDADASTNTSRVLVPLTGGQTYYIAVSASTPNARQYNPVTGENAPSGGSTGSYILSLNVGQANDPNVARRARPGATEQVAGASNGLTVVTTVNNSGQPIAFRQNAQGQWVVTNLSTATGVATLDGDLTPFTGPDGRNYAFGRSGANMLLFTESGGTWTQRNLTTELAAQGATAANDMSVFVDRSGNRQVAGRTDNGNIVLYTGTLSGNNLNWSYANLSTQLTNQGLTTPGYVSKLVSYVTSWNGLTIAGLDAAGAVHAVWWAPGLSAWTTSNLSAITGAPVFTGQLTAYVTSYDATNLVGTDTTGQVLATWWVPGAQWTTSNLTALFNGPRLTSASVSSYVTGWDGTNIAGIDSNGQVQVYWWAPGLSTWQVFNMTTGIAGATPMTTSVRGFTSSTGILNLVGAAANGDVLRYSVNPFAQNAVWAQENLTNIAING